MIFHREKWQWFKMMKILPSTGFKNSGKIALNHCLCMRECLSEQMRMKRKKTNQTRLHIVNGLLFAHDWSGTVGPVAIHTASAVMICHQWAEGFWNRGQQQGWREPPTTNVINGHMFDQTKPSSWKTLTLVWYGNLRLSTQVSGVNWSGVQPYSNLITIISHDDVIYMMRRYGKISNSPYES